MHFDCHAVTVDLEEWYNVCSSCLELPDQPERRVVQATARLLQIFRDCSVKATFFVLGSVASKNPELLPMIHAHGHELASHGWSHSLVSGMDPNAFEDELRMTSELLEASTGCRPTGFRAPRWSLCRNRTPWAFEILSRCGYSYDSSLAPLAAIGNPAGPLVPHLIETVEGVILEFPPMVTQIPLLNLPTAGGWGFRFFPCKMIMETAEKYKEQGNPAVFFIHPREVDPDGPRLSLGLLESFLSYGNRSSAESRIRLLLEKFSFKTMGELASSWKNAF